MQIFQGKYKGTMDCAKKMYNEEGFLSFWNGLSAGLLKQAVFGTIRIALFDIFMVYLLMVKSEQLITITDRTILGLITGCLAVMISNPTDVVKIRFQAAIRAKDNDNGPPKYKNICQAFPKIYREEGLYGFYQSFAPNCLKNSIINAVELATYNLSLIHI